MSDLNFTSYVLYIYQCYVMPRDTHSEPGLPMYKHATRGLHNFRELSQLRRGYLNTEKVVYMAFITWLILKTTRESKTLNRVYIL